jgi:hypothetical protein
MGKTENPEDKKDEPNLEVIYGDIMDNFEAVEPDVTKDPYDDRDPHEDQSKDPHDGSR